MPRRSEGARPADRQNLGDAEPRWPLVAQAQDFSMFTRAFVRLPPAQESSNTVDSVILRQVPPIPA